MGTAEHPGWWFGSCGVAESELGDAGEGDGFARGYLSHQGDNFVESHGEGVGGVSLVVILFLGAGAGWEGFILGDSG